MNIDHILGDFNLLPFKQLFVPLYNAALEISKLDENIRKRLDEEGGDDTIWDKLVDVLIPENQDKEIKEIVGNTEPAVIDFFTEARYCWLMCEDYIEEHPLAFSMDGQVLNVVNMFMNLGAGGPDVIA
jgi:hypothetical protein